MKIFKLLSLSSSLLTISLSLIFDHLSVSLIFSACVAKSCIVTTCNTCVLIFIYQLCWPLANTLEHVSNKYFMSAIMQMNEDILNISHEYHCLGSLFSLISYICYYMCIIRNQYISVNLRRQICEPKGAGFENYILHLSVSRPFSLSLAFIALSLDITRTFIHGLRGNQSQHHTLQGEEVKEVVWMKLGQIWQCYR